MIKWPAARWSSAIALTAIATVQSLLGQTRASTPVQAAPPGWSEAAQTMRALTLDGKDREVVAIAEKWVARYPEFAEAHLRLGGASESLARQLAGSRTPEAMANRTKLFETAAAHLRRGFDLGGGAYPDATIRAVIDIYGAIGLNRPDEQEKVVREAVARFPAQPISHAEMITLLLTKGAAPAIVDKALLAARASLPKTADARFEMASLLAFKAAGRDRLVNLTLAPAARAAMARIAMSLLDDVLTLSAGHKGALEEKARLVRLQTEPAAASRLPAADETGVEGVLRAIASGQATYSAVCAFGFYASTLEALAKPASGEKQGFILASDVPPDRSRVLEKYGYRVEMTAPPSRRSPASCNGEPAGRSSETWSATARPMPGYSGKSYRITTEGVLTEIK
jgi:hypothetical protein